MCGTQLAKGGRQECILECAGAPRRSLADRDGLEGFTICGCGTTVWPPLSPEDLHCARRRNRVDEGVEFIIHYLDDFLLIGRPGTGVCRTLLGVLHKLALPVAPDKLEGPTSRLVFLRFQLDTVAMEVRLLGPKLREPREVI